MRILLPSLLALPLLSTACLVPPADPGPSIPVDDSPEPPKPQQVDIYARALLASQLPPSESSARDGDRATLTSGAFDDPNRLLVVLSSEPFTCSAPFGTAKCTADRTTWSFSFSLWPEQQRPGHYDLFTDVNGGYSFTLGEPGLNCGGGAGTAKGSLVVDAIDERSVRFHLEWAESFSPNYFEEGVLEGRSFVAARCP